MSSLICKDLCKRYGKKEVLTGLDLTIESGKIYGLIGRNGAGKTTLLSMMSNQNPITSGSITLDGESIWENPKALRRICFARELSISPESGTNGYSIKQYFKAAETFFAHWDKDMADRLTERFGLNKKDKIMKLSKGMLSMITIITALASKAEFTFMDEPVAGLDVIAREDFYKLLLDEYAETGRTFVISTHIIEEAANVIEEVIFLNKGNILLKENTAELLDSVRYVTGLSETVDEAVYGLECLRSENMGRSKGVTVKLREGQNIAPGFDVTVQPVSLQKVFTAMCGGEE